MSEHIIRLRGGWSVDSRDGLPPNAAMDRIALPIAAGSDLGPFLALSRGFQRPPVEPGSEAVWLRLEAVPGLIELHLNGCPLDLPEERLDFREIELTARLLPRNELVLRADLSRVEPLRGENAPPWGRICLVIRPARTGDYDPTDV